MLDKAFVKKLSPADCNLIEEHLEVEVILTNTRIERLQTTQAKNPTWAAYDKYADDLVGIDIRIEEQNAVAGMLEDDLRLIRERREIIKIGAVKGKPERHSQSVMRLEI